MTFKQFLELLRRIVLEWDGNPVKSLLKAMELILDFILSMTPEAPAQEQTSVVLPEARKDGMSGDRAYNYARTLTLRRIGLAWSEVQRASPFSPPTWLPPVLRRVFGLVDAAYRLGAGAALIALWKSYETDTESQVRTDQAPFRWRKNPARTADPKPGRYRKAGGS